MPVTVLDDHPALLVVDLQRGTTRNPFASPVEGVIANAAALARSFRARSLPVALAVMDLAAATPGRSDVGGRPSSLPADFTDLVPEMDPVASDIRVTKRTWSCFAGTPLHALLQERGVTQVIIAGVATSFGVESTARQAYDLGYNVVLPTDAMTDIRAESHDNSVSRVFPILGQTGTTSDILALAESWQPAQ
jgi:nicotinamidase-related amidase